ncbi:PAAR domain-containing protein [Pseudomonas sp.]|uniref:PAAR domain-containing protein n=1 Tax=Pseudomonas sp. TaxID=306 RepID=UPI0028A8F143|nr:DUF2235 domain-containing protein [Pseudomonas sp.]
MSGKPAARLSDPTACPKTGHGTNPIAAGSPDVFFDGLPAARQGDSTGCGSALSSNLIANVLINGKPAATLGSLGDHGNVVIGGSGTVIVGSTSSPASFTPPLPLAVEKQAHAKALDRPASPYSPTAPQPNPGQTRARKEETAHPATHGLEQEEEEEELDSRQAVTLRIGVFFDGTGNNAGNSAIGARCRGSAFGLGEWEAHSIAQRCERHHLDPDSSYGNAVSNIWQLYNLYPEDPVAKELSDGLTAFLPIYITGAGTDTGEPDSLLPGMALGQGATGVMAKVDEGFELFAQALNRFEEENPAALLCRLELDIFGFSRGAAAARHFANQILACEQGPLGDLRRAGKLGQAPGFDWRKDVLINFIGLFDTVAAIGGWDDRANPADDRNKGIDLHLAPDAARQVVQLVARDEFRYNFALNRVAPPHREIVLPGAHSDLGGGYPEEMRERIYLMRPHSNYVARDTSPFSTLAYRDANNETLMARELDLLDPLDASARLETDIWEHLPAFSGNRHNAMKYVLAAPLLERKVYGHLSRVYLRVMRSLAHEAGVPFKKIPVTEDSYLPAELAIINGKLMAKAHGADAELDSIEQRLLRQRYIHVSAHWNASVGNGGSLLDVAFINAPAVHRRARYADKPAINNP